MVSFFFLLNRLLDLLLRPLEGLSPLWPLAGGAVLVGVAAMAIYKVASPQAAIRDAKDKIKAHFYEVWLYLDEASVILRAQLNLLLSALRYLAYALIPLGITIVIFFPLFAHFETRYAFRPLHPDEEVLVEVRLEKYFDGWEKAVELEAPPGITLVGFPLRFIRKSMDPKNVYKELRREYVVNYKLRAEEEGRKELRLTVRGRNFTLPLVVSSRYGLRVNPYETTRLSVALLYPPTARLPKESGADLVRITYPRADFSLFGWKTWWVWPFLIISMIAAWAVKGIFRVEI